MCSAEFTVISVYVVNFCSGHNGKIPQNKLIGFLLINVFCVITCYGNNGKIPQKYLGFAS